MKPDLVHLVSLLLCYVQKAQSECYHPDGSLVGVDKSGGAYVPCNIDGGMCCALGRPSTSPFVDYCRSDGLCESPKSGDVYRESCSDPTWTDPRCLNLCVNAGTFIGTCVDIFSTWLTSNQLVVLATPLKITMLRLALMEVTAVATLTQRVATAGLECGS